jgi:hypothetical protein
MDWIVCKDGIASTSSLTRGELKSNIFNLLAYNNAPQPDLTMNDCGTKVVVKVGAIKQLVAPNIDVPVIGILVPSAISMTSVDGNIFSPKGAEGLAKMFAPESY